MDPIDFNSTCYDGDSRFTSGLDASKENPDFYERIMSEQRYIRETGSIFFGHSSPVLVETALELEPGAIAKNYDWPEPFASMSSAQRYFAVSRLAFDAYPYVCAENNYVVTSNNLHEKHSLKLDRHTSVNIPNSQAQYSVLLSLNRTLATLNPTLAPVLAVCEETIANGYHYNALNFVHGVLFRMPETDILLFQYCRHDDFFGLPIQDERIGINIWREVDPYLFRDVDVGWVLSKHTAEVLLNRVHELQADAVAPFIKRYYDQNANYPFQQAFERRVQENLARHRALVLNGSDNIPV